MYIPTRLSQPWSQLKNIAVIVTALATVLARSAGTPPEEAQNQQLPAATPDRSRLQIIDPEPPTELTDPAAIAAYRQGYSNMGAATWPAAIAAHDEAIRIQPEVAGLYEARGTARMYGGNDHGEAHRRLYEGNRARTSMTRDTDDAEHTPTPSRPRLNPTRQSKMPPVPLSLIHTISMGYGHRAVASTQLSAPGLGAGVFRHEPPHRAFRRPRPGSVQVSRVGPRKLGQLRRSRQGPPYGRSRRVAADLGLNRTALVILKTPHALTPRATTPADRPTLRSLCGTNLTQLGLCSRKWFA